MNQCIFITVGDHSYSFIKFVEPLRNGFIFNSELLLNAIVMLCCCYAIGLCLVKDFSQILSKILNVFNNLSTRIVVTHQCFVTIDFPYARDASVMNLDVV